MSTYELTKFEDANSERLNCMPCTHTITTWTINSINLKSTVRILQALNEGYKGLEFNQQKS